MLYYIQYYLQSQIIVASLGVARDSAELQPFEMSAESSGNFYKTQKSRSAVQWSSVSRH